jgi:hypothetical protein
VTVIIEPTDLPATLQSHELVDTMVDAANARASRVAPCLTWTGTPEDEPVPTADQLAEAKLVLIGAVMRWAEAGSGALQQQTAGPFGVTVDTRQRTGFNLWPSEIEDLQDICRAAGSGGTGRAFEVDTMPSDAGVCGVDYWWSSPTDRAAF